MLDRFVLRDCLFCFFKLVPLVISLKSLLPILLGKDNLLLFNLLALDLLFPLDLKQIVEPIIDSISFLVFEFLLSAIAMKE